MKTHGLFVGLVLCAPMALGGCEHLEELAGLLGGGNSGSPGLPPPQACTLAGCSDVLNATIRSKESFPSGRHVVVIEAQGSPARTCTFQFPIAGEVEPGKCESGITLTVAPVVTCTGGTEGNSAWQQCTPVPGRFEERIYITGTPAWLRVTQRVDGGPAYLDREVAVPYQEVHPNGRQCAPVCKQARLEWDF